MKLIAIDRTFGQQSTDSLAFIPDSALQPGRKPLFLPDTATSWAIEIYPLVRFSHQGKSIPERFARRYYDSVTLAARLTTTATGLDPLQARLIANADASWSIGQWIPYDPGTALTITADGLDPLQATVDIDGITATVSRWLTIKTGDIIAPWKLPGTLTPAADTIIHADIDGQRVLSLKIK